MLPPELDELTLLIYSCPKRSASEEIGKCPAATTAEIAMPSLLDKVT
jgi:hypothetical protein